MRHPNHFHLVGCHVASCYRANCHRKSHHRCVPSDLCRAPCLQSTGLARAARGALMFSWHKNRETSYSDFKTSDVLNLKTLPNFNDHICNRDVVWSIQAGILDVDFLMFGPKAVQSPEFNLWQCLHRWIHRLQHGCQNLGPPLLQIWSATYFMPSCSERCQWMLSKLPVFCGHSNVFLFQSAWFSSPVCSTPSTKTGTSDQHSFQYTMHQPTQKEFHLHKKIQMQPVGAV